MKYKLLVNRYLTVMEAQLPFNRGHIKGTIFVKIGESGENVILKHGDETMWVSKAALRSDFEVHWGDTTLFKGAKK